MQFDRELPFSPVCRLDALDPFPPLPTELILVILELACMDGGQTARTLCLVSKHFYVLAKPLLFCSIAVCGVDQIEAFSHRLEQDPLAPATVRHLFISERMPYNRAKGSRFPFRKMPEGMSLRIIQAVAPFLETLCYLPFNDYCDITCLAGVSFPRSRELAITTYPPPCNFDYPPPTVPIPLLERLHVRAPYPSHYLQHLSQLYPRLTHLKVSGFEDGGDCLIHELRRLWGIPSTESSEHLALGLPPLRRIVLQHAPLRWDINFDDFDGFDVRDAKFWRDLARIKEVAELAESEVAVGLSVEEPADVGVKQLKLDWLSRLDGGQGCWGVRRSVD
ncbi:hypothetical protein BOTBODRAFT_185967 [Botryobasidium botryosum FD-172 SS1]|uniref:F-box domain-containing protein n=1 Tax=Botryobasidium botryosum (strain FD-172 SS1) TaxID=930990 RepID=A0A067N0F2_BOTB1|nr:hypothetical protein BOTBODRAFT_185967 [Botryobasidium botryosum FD-172 SS1]